jgi:excisionase family DNA binding protein
VQGEDFYTVDEAAKILRLTRGRIRQKLRAGELAGA